VKFAVSHLLPQQPDIVVSGMNLGENSGTSSIYSGTVAAAREGALWGIPSFAFSVAGSDPTLPSAYAVHAASILGWLASLEEGALLRNRCQVFYNVNFPDCAPSACRGTHVTRQSLAFFDDRYRVTSGDDGRESFQLYGEKHDLETDVEYDSRALLDGYATVTPMSIDATDDGVLALLQKQASPSLLGE
jgi:5'-nucleotidase